MKIVIAPDKFKGSLDAAGVASAIARGIREVIPAAEIDECPIADGGEGTVAALVSATSGRFVTERVVGPLPEMKVDARFGILGDGKTAVIEMAAASGLALLKLEDRNPLNTTTYGTGQLLLAAANRGVDHIILGIGGSATIDAGIGCAQACGLPVVLQEGEPVAPTGPLCGRDLPAIVLIKHARGSAVERCRITVACDVSNPLYGPNGAAPVFGPQKGASPQVVEHLDRDLRRLAELLGKTREAQTPGAGAAGGLGFAMLAFFNASLRSGVDIVIEATGITERLRDADLCITGEGRLDRQSLSGKAPIGIARLCKRLNVPCIAFVGSVGEGADAAFAEGIISYHSINDGSLSVEESMQRAPQLLSSAASKLLRQGTLF